MNNSQGKPKRVHNFEHSRKSAAISQEIQQNPELPSLQQISQIVLFLAECKSRNQSRLVRMAEELETLPTTATHQKDELMELIVEAKCLVNFSSRIFFWHFG